MLISYLLNRILARNCAKRLRPWRKNWCKSLISQVSIGTFLRTEACSHCARKTSRIKTKAMTKKLCTQLCWRRGGTKTYRLKMLLPSVWRHPSRKVRNAKRNKQMLILKTLLSTRVHRASPTLKRAHSLKVIGGVLYRKILIFLYLTIIKNITLSSEKDSKASPTEEAAQ